MHHHFVSPGYSAALKQMGQGHAKWSVQMSLDDMDKSGIQTSLLSLIQPAMAVGDVALGRFGSFACLAVYRHRRQHC